MSRVLWVGGRGGVLSPLVVFASAAVGLPAVGADPDADADAGEDGVVLPCTEEAFARGLLYVIQPYPQAYGNQGFGCGFADLDADGDPDAVIIGAANGRVGIFENDGTGHFTDRSLDSGIPLLPQGSGLAAADYDGDGAIDLFITQLGQPNVLMRNERGFAFSNVTLAAGLLDLGAGEAACFGDYTGDGWLDLYVCNYAGKAPGPGNNLLYRNVGDGTFVNESVAQTVDDAGYGFQAVWFDYDLDGDVDLYLSNDRGHLGPLFAGNRLWRNDGGQMVDVSAGSGANLGLFSMGVACGDFDTNGYPDLYCTNIQGSYAWGTNNPLLLNQGDGTFLEQSIPAGVDNPWATSWGAIFFDFDNNGDLDLYVNNQFFPNKLYLNEGYPCGEVAAAAAVAGSSGKSFCSAVADVDGDGDLDLLLNNLGLEQSAGALVQLFINHEGEMRNWIRYDVAGLGGNLHAVGARIETRFGFTWRLREILAGGNSFLGQNELTVHVGAGASAQADEVVVTWPGGSPTRTLTNLPVNERWTLYPPERLGDADGDGAVLLADFFAFMACFGGLVTPGCEMMDLDGDGDVDPDDFAALLLVYADPLDDCDGNGVTDLEQILLDPGLDADGDGHLDACGACPGDLDGSGDVAFADLLLFLSGWGPCRPEGSCAADLDGDGTVGFADLLLLLAAWGGCS